MNPLESRIQAAIRAAADEVRPEDIPPLRLRAHPRRLRLGSPAFWFGMPRRLGDDADAPARWPRRIRVSRPDGSARRWLAPLAAAVSLAAVVVLLVALGRASGPGLGGSPAGSATATPAQKLLVKEALDAYFPATGTQYTTGLGFAWTRQTIVAMKAGACLTHAGYPPQSFPKIKRRYQLSFPDNNQFPDLAQRKQTRSMAPAGGNVRSDRARPWAHGAEPVYAPAARHCMVRYVPLLWRLDKIADPLAVAWLTEVESIQSSLSVRAMRGGFVSCLESYGVPARFATARGADSGHLFTGFFAWMSRLGASNSSPQRYANQQRLWTPVFVTCARPTVTTMQRLQISARSKFLHAHARQVATIRRIAAAIAAAR